MLCEYLQKGLTQGAISVVLAVVLSILADYVPGFVAMEAKWKRVIVLIVCAAIPFGSIGLSIAFGCLPGFDQNLVVMALIAGLGAFEASQITHIRKLG
jgi:hypothetical protein